VPKRLVKEHRWLSDGTIVQHKDPDHRMVFFEIDNINGTFANIEEIIGMPIERIIIEAKRRATFDFVDHMLPGVVKAVLRVVGARPIIRNIAILASVMGYGHVELVSIRRVHGKGDYATLRVTEPYSLPLFCGDLAGSFNAVDRREVGIDYEEVSPDVFDITGHVSKHPMELKERLQTKPYTHKAGEIELERCSTCGGPKALSQYHWDLDRGVVENKSTGRRMAMLGPAALDAIFEELEKELGENIPEVVIEAQRRFVKAGFSSSQEVRGVEDFRHELALRGVGNLKEFEADKDEIRVRIENPCLYLMLVGLIQGLYELAFGREGDLEWELAQDGDLTVRVTTRQ
jgi:hypothetical protein